jgi:hypothetical protein
VIQLYTDEVPRSTLGKDWDSAVKAAAKELGWNTAGGGYLYRSNSSHIFTLSLPRPRNGVATGSIDAKPLALDPLFWDIMGMNELSSKRVGFRVSGAFTVPMVTETSRDFQFDGDVYKSTDEVVQGLHGDFLAVESRLQSLSDFDSFVRSEGQVNIRSATLATLMIALDRHNEAELIARAEIDQGDSGGFSTAGGSFNELLLDYLGFAQERGDHVLFVGGSTRLIFPGYGKTVPIELKRRVFRLDGSDNSSLCLWRFPRGADRSVRGSDWDSDTYIQCAGSAEGIMIEVRMKVGDRSVRSVVGKNEPAGNQSVIIRRGDFREHVFENESFSVDEVTAVFQHYSEHDGVPPSLRLRAVEVTAKRLYTW